MAERMAYNPAHLLKQEMPVPPRSLYFTHQPFLLHYARKTSGPILELGMGFGSTPALHELCQEQQRKLISVENVQQWADKFAHLRSKSHLIFCIDWDSISKQIGMMRDSSDRFGVVFIDNEPWEARDIVLKKFRNDTEFVVVHDYINTPLLKYCHAYAPLNKETGPATLVGSMHRQDVNDPL